MSEPKPLFSETIFRATCAWESDNAVCGNTVDIAADVVLGIPRTAQAFLRLASKGWMAYDGKAYCPDCRESVLA